jgi:outer membrane protein W
MILPCRIRGYRNHVPPLRFALFFAACFLAPIGEAVAQGADGSAPEQTGVSWFPAVPLHITAGVDLGYDDHVLGSNATTGASGQGSFSVRENLVLTYDRSSQGTDVHLTGVGSFTQFVSAGTNDKDVSLTLGFTHNFSTRLSFRADLYVAYQTEPDFQSNVGPENVRAPHFFTDAIFSVTYRWLPRVSTSTSYTFRPVKYEQTTPTTTAIGIAQDRVEHTFAEGLHFSVTGRTSLVVEYRYQIVDYDTAPRDSTTHFALVGFNHRFTEQLQINVLGGSSFRSFKDDGSSIDPYAEVGINYQGGNHSLSWLTTYGVNQPTQTLAMGTTTFRTGLNARYKLTSRLNARAAVYYYNSDNQGSSGTTSAGSQDGLEFTLGLNYTINKRWTVNADYAYSAQFSSGATGGYSRNHYFAGVTYHY